MKLIVISSPGYVPDEQRRVDELFDLGLEVLHVRKPFYSRDELRIWIEAVRPCWRNRLVVHSHFECLEEFMLKGVHLNEASRQIYLHDRRLMDRWREKGSLSTSYHSLVEVDEAPLLWDYAFLSPIFDCISKPGRSAAFSEPEIQKTLSSSGPAVYALGGVTAERIEAIRRMGFSGAAVLGSIWNTERPLHAYRELCQACSLHGERRVIESSEGCHV